MYTVYPGEHSREAYIPPGYTTGVYREDTYLPTGVYREDTYLPTGVYPGTSLIPTVVYPGTSLIPAGVPQGVLPSVLYLSGCTTVSVVPLRVSLLLYVHLRVSLLLYVHLRVSPTWVIPQGVSHLGYTSGCLSCWLYLRVSLLLV